MKLTIEQGGPLRSQHTLPKWHVYQDRSNDCGPYCVAIVGNTLRDASVTDAATLARSMEHYRRFLLPARISGWATFPWGIVWAFKRLGIAARWRMLQSREVLWDNLRRGVVTIVLAGDPFYFHKGHWKGWSHYKILYSWDIERGWAFVDPAVRQAPGLSWQEDASFWQQWSRLGRQVVEVTDSPLMK